MSTTTTPTPAAPTLPMSAFAENAAITAATTIADVGAAMRNDPAIMSGVLAAAGQLQAALASGTGKALIGSKTFWAVLITPAVSFGVTHFGLHLDDATVGEITTGLTTLAALLTRLVTKEPITGVFTA